MANFNYHKLFIFLHTLLFFHHVTNSQANHCAFLNLTDSATLFSHTNFLDEAGLKLNLENFPKSLTEHDKVELVRLWQHKVMSFNLKESIRSGQFQQLDKDGVLYENVTNPTCVAHMRHFTSQISWSHDPANGLKAPATWALQMLDAWGGVPDGILSGHTVNPGDFPECVQVRANFVNDSSGQTDHFAGRYIFTNLIPIIPGTNKSIPFKFILYPDDPKKWDHQDDLLQLIGRQFGRDESNDDTPWRRKAVSFPELQELMQNGSGFRMIPLVGHCFPSSCTKGDVQTILDNAIQTLTCGVVHPVIIYETVEEKPPFSAGDIAMIVVWSIIGGLCVLGTAVDLLVVRKRKSGQADGIGFKAITSFSVYTNTIKWLNTKSAGENFGCMHGLRFLSLCWVVLCHTFLMITYSLQWNLVDLNKARLGSWTVQVIINGFGSVDTFFTLSGTLASYNILKELDRSRGRLNVPLLYLQRYLRLTPSYMMSVGMVATLLPHMGNGPMWHWVESEAAACRKTWWHNMLYITNMIKYHPDDGEEMCFADGWYLSNDMQLFLLAPLIVYPLWRWRRVGLGILGAFGVTSILTPVILTIVKGFGPNFLSTEGDYEFDMYHKPWIRMAPYLVGIFMGYILHTQSKSKAKSKNRLRQLPKWAALTGWLFCTVTALAIVFGLAAYLDPEYWKAKTVAKTVATVLYAGLHRFLWGMVICWIIYACVNGQGGWINDFLSWTAFVPLSRLTYAVYISSFHIQLLFHTTTMHPWHYTSYTYFIMFLAHIVMSLLIGYIVSMTVESPFLQLEKLAFQPGRRQPPTTPTATPTATDTFLMGHVNDGSRTA